MNSLFGSDFFSANRARLRELFTGTAPVVITANGLLQRSGDTAFPFEQDRNFWYLTGIDDPDVLLVLDKSREYLIAPARDDKREVFDGSVSFQELSRRSGVETVLSAKDGWKLLETRMRKVKHVATIAAPAGYLELYGMYTNPARARLIRKLKSFNSAIELLDVSEHLVRLRMVKQPQELAAIRTAIGITTDSMKDALRPAKRAKYTNEYEIEAEITRGFRRRGATGHAFDPIVAAGFHATTIHYLQNDGALSSDELVTLDIGAQVEQYAADLTRTVPLGDMSRRQRQVFDAVVDVQEHAYGLLQPGVRIPDYEKQIEAYMGEKLRELGLIKTIESDQVREYYPHATSHHLGLNVHDVADYHRPLEPNMVITVEPGIYIPEEGIGVRIEDDVLITESGIEVLSSALPTRFDS